LPKFKKKVATYNESTVCGSDGNFYDSTIDFCVEQNVNDELTRVSCDGACSEQKCAVAYCMANDPLTDASFPLCGNDNTLYADKNEY
jgi:hypothetical protein